MSGLSTEVPVLRMNLSSASRAVVDEDLDAVARGAGGRAIGCSRGICASCGAVGDDGRFGLCVGGKVWGCLVRVRQLVVKSWVYGGLVAIESVVWEGSALWAGP